MIGKNFYKNTGYRWKETDDIIMCSDGDHTLFTVFRSDQREEMINIYRAGLARGLNEGRRQGVRDFLGVLGLRLK